MLFPGCFIWVDEQLVPWNEAQVHVLAHTLHYGAGAARGSSIFRLERYIARLLLLRFIIEMLTLIYKIFYS